MRRTTVMRYRQIAILCIVLSACGDSPSEPAPPAVALLTILSGDGQIGVVNGHVEPFEVLARTADGVHLSGVAIVWTVVAGGGAVSPQQSTTTQMMSRTETLQRYAQTTLALGPAEGVNTVTAGVAGNPAVQPVTFTATAFTGLIEVRASDYYSCIYYDMCDGEFAPAEIVVPVGSGVGWKWIGSSCDLQFEDRPAEPVSSPVRVDGWHARTFSAPGSYRYRCTLHSTSFEDGMVGVVHVQ